MKILVFAPHNDDETLGCGGSIAKYAEGGHEVYVCEATSGQEIGMVERIKKEALKAHEILGVKETFFLDLPVVALKEVPAIELNLKIAQIVQRVKPDLAFIPHKGDMHTDHEMVAKAAMVALRPIENPQLKGIYAYETLSETEWNIPTVDNAFIPNLWNPIEKHLEQKLKAMECYKTQLKEFPNPRSLKAIEALARLRGSTIGAAAAESFMVLREILYI